MPTRKNQWGDKFNSHNSAVIIRNVDVAVIVSLLTVAIFLACPLRGLFMIHDGRLTVHALKLMDSAFQGLSGELQIGHSLGIDCLRA